MATIISPLQATWSGISFPPRKGAAHGFFDISCNEDVIRESIHVILNTQKGSVPMNYNFGNSAYDLLFEPVNDVTQGLIADGIKKDIETWEPRVAVVGIKALSFDNVRVFDMTLKIKSNGQLINNVVSFSV
jgi:phage baseplate assembly protein W